MQYLLRNPYRGTMSTFKHIFDEIEDVLSTSWDYLPTRSANSKFKIKSTEDAVEITAEVPGFSKKDISITTEDNILIIKGELSNGGDTDGDLIKSNSFEKRYTVSNDMDVDNTVAKCTNGMLMVNIPKVVPEIVSKTIKIK